MERKFHRLSQKLLDCDEVQCKYFLLHTKKNKKNTEYTSIVQILLMKKKRIISFHTKKTNKQKSAE